uniref:HDNR domain-containing protein n=1 Tax=Macrostomum lignano TaxID=282301 RepID=A0A1I8HDV6_9PLAT
MASNVELKRTKNLEYSCDESTDPYTGLPKTPNVPYSNMTKSARIFSRVQGGAARARLHPGSPEGGRYYIDRYADSMSQHLFRDQPTPSNPHCYIGDRLDRELPPDHSASRPGAYFSWGPNRAGEKTLGHFDGESPVAFLPVDTYHRPPTNLPGEITFKYGRPGDGYYAQRNPQSNTWFASSHRLNEQRILQNIRPKTLAEYEQISSESRSLAATRRDEEKYPEYSEYTAKYTVQERTPTASSDS